MAKRGGRGWSGLVIGLLVVLVLAWLGYWGIARFATSRALDRAEAGPIAGNDIACPDRDVGGFPLRIDVTCRTLSVRRAGALDAELGGVAATAPLYRPGVVAAALTGPLTLNAPVDGLALTVGWTLGETEAVAGLDGLKSASARFLRLEAENAGGALPVIAASATRAEGAADPASGGAYRFRALAEDLLLRRRNGELLPETDIDIVVRALDFGNSLGTDPRRAVLDWLEHGGALKIERARIGAGGAVVDADGTLAISSDGVLSGNLNLRFVDLEALGELIVSLRPELRDYLDPAMAAITAMSTPVETDVGPARQTPLVISDGLVAVGIIPVGVLPALPL